MLLVRTCVVNENVHVGLGVFEAFCGIADGLEGGKVQVVDDHRVASLLVDLFRGRSGLLEVAAQHHHPSACRGEGRAEKKSLASPFITSRDKMRLRYVL